MGKCFANRLVRSRIPGGAAGAQPDGCPYASPWAMAGHRGVPTKPMNWLGHPPSLEPKQTCAHLALLGDIPSRGAQQDVVDEPGAAHIGGDTEGRSLVHGPLDGFQVLDIHQLQILD